MTRFDRLVLDAVQRHSPEATYAKISDYIAARRWCLFGTPASGWIYVALMQFENAGWITSRWQDGPFPRRRVYSVTAQGAAV